jgi:TatA/E family protein of Tat protein translocase
MSGGEILLIFLAILVLFGADKMPGMARGIGKGMREFQKAADEIKSEFINSTSDIKNEMNNIRSDIHDNISKTGQTITEARNEVHSTISDSTAQSGDGKPDESYGIYEEAQKASASQAPNVEAKVDNDHKETDQKFLDVGANI